MNYVQWKPQTEGERNNLIIETITNQNAADDSLAVGIVNAVSDDAPLIITGETVLKNISALHGSAIGFYTEGARDLKDYTRFHQLDISGIHGSDLSVGNFGAAGIEYVENATIDMTSGTEYAGAYTASAEDSKQETVNQFAIAGGIQGNIYMDNPAGNYIIRGNILADAGYNILAEEAKYNLLALEVEHELQEPGLSEEDKKGLQDQLRSEADRLAEFRSYGHVNLAGHLNLAGDVYAENRGILNLHLQNGSYWEGLADDYADFDTAGRLMQRRADIRTGLNQSAFGKQYKWQEIADLYHDEYNMPYCTSGMINLSMNDGSIWQTRGRNFLSTLQLHRGGLVDMRKEQGGSITIGNLTGEGGTFLMDFSKDAKQSDMLYVKDIREAGRQHIQAHLMPGTQLQDLNGIRFATTGGDDYKRDPASKFAVDLYHNQGVNNIALRVKNERFDPQAAAANERFNGGKDGSGTYKPGNDYVTAIFSGKPLTKDVWDIEKIMKDNSEGKRVWDENGHILPEYYTSVLVDNPVKEGTNWFIDTAVFTPSDSGKIIKKSSQLNYTDAIYGIYTDTLNKRLGDARYSADSDGMWARVRHDRLGREALYDARNTMTELGYDWTRAETASGRHIQGAAFDLMNGSADYKELDGNSDVKRYGAWFYDTHFGNDGYYTDFLAKYGRLFNKFNLLQDNGMPVQGDYHNNYYSLSLEYGRKLPLSSSWYIEPQAQAQYTYLGSTDYHTTQGSRVHLAGTDSFISRLGFRLGQDMGKQLTFYINADFMHEFLGNQDIFAQDMTGSMNITGHNDGSWYDVGFGLTTHLNKDAYAFVNCDKSFGSKIEHTWSMEAGINWQF